MKHIVFTPNPTNKYKVALLIKSDSLDEKILKNNFITPLIQLGLKAEDIIAMDLTYDKKKVSAKHAKEYLNILLKALDSLDITHILMADSEYFKIAAGLRKVLGQDGYVLPIAIKGYEHINIINSLNPKALFYNPALQSKLTLSLETLTNSINGLHFDLGTNIIKSEYYPDTLQDITKALDDLHQHSMLTCDIETYGLSFLDGIGTISFAWSKNKGIAFNYSIEKSYIKSKLKPFLKNFFETYEGTLIYHNATFDIKFLIYTLFMDNALDNKGLVDGLEIMTKSIHDTKVLAYLATNTTAGNSLSLKHLAHEFAGNYAQEDINDITLIPRDELLRYNLIDCLCTWFVYTKYYHQVVMDNQLNVYNSIMLPSIKTIIHMELTGLCLDMEKVINTENGMKVTLFQAKDAINNTPTVIQFEDQLRKEEMITKNLLLKKKVKPLSDFADIVYNPSSTKQTSKLLYDWMKLPVLDTTDGGAPAVGAKTIKKLINHTDNLEYKNILECLIDIAEVSIILNTFVSAFLHKSIIKGDGYNYLHGNFNLNGTKSGRMSSSKVNLQNLPSTGSKYAKAIKKCFTAPTGWVMMGSDYASLEATIDALTTKDPNKLAVYTEGMDSHSFNAFTYWPEQMPDIQNALTRANNSSKLYKVIHDDGNVSYHTEDEKIVKDLL